MWYRGTILIWILVMPGISQIVKASDTIAVNNSKTLYALVEGDDTIYVSAIKEVRILPMPKFTSRKSYRKYQRLVYNIKKVYPYAKLAGVKYNEFVMVFDTIETERDRNDFMKQMEIELKNEFEGELKKLTITQGRLLLKMIDRETGHSSYELLKEFRGSFSAFFWQTLARLFGNDLKSEFDEEGEDQLINQIILLIENGQL